MKKLTFQWKVLITVTVINVLIATGYSIAGLISPQKVLPVSAIPTSASFIFALYAAARTIPLCILVFYSAIAMNKKYIWSLAILAGLVQLIDGFIGIYQQDIMKSVGPFFVAFLEFATLLWVQNVEKT